MHIISTQMQVTEEVRIWRTVISFSGKRWRMYSEWEIKEHKWGCEGIKTFLFLGDTSKRNLPIWLVQSCLFSKPGSIWGLCTEERYGVSKGKHNFSEILVLSSKRTTSQAAWHPTSSHSQILYTPDIPCFWFTTFATFCTNFFLAMAKLFPAPENTFYSIASSRSTLIEMLLSCV